MKSLLPLSCALLLSSLAITASEPGHFDRTVKTSGNVDVDVRSDRGGIIITTGPTAAVRVRAIIKSMYGRVDLNLSEANIRALEKNPPIEQVGNRIRIGHVTDQAILRGVSMRLEIELPVGTNIRAQTVSGGIRIVGVTGSVATETISGRTEINDAGGSITAESRSGAILMTQLAPADIRARTRSGRIEATLAKQGGYRIDARTDSGKISGSATSDRRQGADRRRLQKQIGAAGGPLVELVAHSSEIAIN